MVANHQNWQRLGIMLTERLQELRCAGAPVYWAESLPSNTYATSLLCGRARLKLEYVKPIAQALNLDEDRLFWTALEGMLDVSDVALFREHFKRLKVPKKKKRK